MFGPHARRSRSAFVKCLNIRMRCFSSRIPTGVTMVQDVESARLAMDTLMNAPADAIFACDTEVADIDVSRQSPVGNGVVICASVYGGPEINFGTGPKLWIDNLDDAEGILDEFKDFFESTTILKAWHNYSFDRHVLFNHNIDVQGLGGDTMHMARLLDTARAQRGGYSLESLSAEILDHKKIPMKSLFAVPKLKKDGSPGKETFVPPVETLQREMKWREQWIDYSTYDAEATWQLFQKLRSGLQQRKWLANNSLWEFYCRYWVPFAHVLTDMERAGIQVDVSGHLPRAQALAEKQRQEATELFLQWAEQYCSDASRMNVSSDVQRAHFLFAPTKKQSSRRSRAGQTERSLLLEPPQRIRINDKLSRIDAHTCSESESDFDDIESNDDSTEENSKALDKLLPSGAKVWPQERAFKVENFEEYVEEGKSKPKKYRHIVLKGLGIPAVARTTSGWPAVSATVLKKLSGSPFENPPNYGTAFGHFATEEEGKAACEAIARLHDIGLVDTMLSNFIVPLQQMADSWGRVHCSMNLNTETGRLSARRPNLQNQPALEKDRYKVRQAFHAAPGKRLIVADYGQLELRLLAHMANCKSMIDAFAAGGDFHSRTALGMYDHIKEAIDRGEVALEWNEADGTSPVPLLKNIYSSERRKAKILNFSIAYGKTPNGLAKDFGVSLEEARETVDRWYADRPEVRAWQERVLIAARAENATRTLMGRYRDLPDINSKIWKARGHAERAAINTPIQGGAADVVMMAMLKIAQDTRLQKLGWKMLLQIHDEVILEGPEESTDEALHCVIEDMCNPFQKPLRVDLVVDANAAATWYDAK